MPITSPVATSSKAAPPHKIHLNYVSRHATERYRETHPAALFDDLITAFEAGTQMMQAEWAAKWYPVKRRTTVASAS